jgi:hypothetical protein
MARALWEAGAIKTKGEAARIAAFCIDIRKRGVNANPSKYKLLPAIRAAQTLTEKLDLCKYAIASAANEKESLKVPIKVAIALNDQDLFNKIRDISDSESWLNQLSQISRYSSQYLPKTGWWKDFSADFSSDEKIKSGFLQAYKNKLEERLEKIDRILGGGITEEDKEWLKALEGSNDYSYFDRENKTFRLKY